jgi:hypothetical protein
MIEQQFPEDEAAYRLREQVLAEMPEKIIPVVDHQDIGIHNMIINPEGKIFLIDEEGFGVMPFGYTQLRCLYGEAAYGLCRNDEERRVYLSTYNEAEQSYLESTMNYWRLLNQYRGIARSISVGNISSAERKLKAIVNN